VEEVNEETHMLRRGRSETYCGLRVGSFKGALNQDPTCPTCSEGLKQAKKHFESPFKPRDK
jgi:hypothetical protein